MTQRDEETTLMSRLLNDWGASTSLLKFISGNETEPVSSKVGTTQGEIQNDDAPKAELDLDDLDADELDEATMVIEKEASKETEEKPKIQHPYVLTRCAQQADRRRLREEEVLMELHVGLISMRSTRPGRWSGKHLTNCIKL